MSAATAYRRDHETARKAAGVRVCPTHWASITVHAFWRWLDETTLLTWCGIDCDLEDGARQTTELVSCLACPVASMQAFREP